VLLGCDLSICAKVIDCLACNTLGIKCSKCVFNTHLRGRDVGDFSGFLRGIREDTIKFLVDLEYCFVRSKVIIFSSILEYCY